MGRLEEIDSLIDRVRRLVKAPPGPKPARFGDDVGWDEGKRRWTKRPVEGVVEEETASLPKLGRVTGKVNWIEPVIKMKGGKPQQQTLDGKVVPPAWRSVRINGDRTGNWQAIGVDSAGRTVMLPSDKFTQQNAKVKFARRRDFAKQLSKLRKSVDADFERTDAAKVLAIIDATSFRVGGEDSKVYGVTTLLGRHVEVEGEFIEFDFIGKKGVRNHKTIKSARLARMLTQRKQAAGPDGQLFDADAPEVRKYMGSIGFGRFTPKDFRTHAGTEMARREVSSMPVPGDGKEFRRSRLAVGRKVAEWLGNTPAVSLGSYIDASVFRSWEKAVEVTKGLAPWETAWQPEFDLGWEDGEDGIVVTEETDE